MESQEQYPESRREEIDYFWIFPTILKTSVGWSEVNQNLYNVLFQRERETDRPPDGAVSFLIIDNIYLLWNRNVHV